MLDLPPTFPILLAQAQAVQVASIPVTGLPTVEAVLDGPCPFISVQLPPGSTNAGSELVAGSGELSFPITGARASQPASIAIPHALRTVIEDIRFVPGQGSDNVLLLSLAGEHSAAQQPSDQAGVLNIELSSASCTASALQSRTPGSEEGGERALALAEDAIRSGNFETAQTHLSDILKAAEGPATPRARELSGVIFERMGMTREARTTYLAFLEDYPGHVALPRINQRLSELGAPQAEERDANAATEAVQSGGELANGSRWRTSLRGFFSQYYLYDRSRARIFDRDGTFAPGFVDTRINTDELLTRAEATLVATDGTTSIEAHASAGHAAEFRPVQLTGSDRNQGSYWLLDELYLGATFGDRAHRLTVGRQKEYGLGIFGRFDGVFAGLNVTDRIGLRAAVGRPVWSERQTSLNEEQFFYSLGVDLAGKDDRWNFGVYWFDQRAAGEKDRQAIGAHFAARGKAWQIDGLVDYDLAFDTLNAAQLRGSWFTDSGATASLTGRIQHYPALSLTNAIIGQKLPKLRTILELESLDHVRSAASDRSLRSSSINLATSFPIATDLRVTVDAELFSLSGDPGSLGIPAYLKTGTQFRASTQAIASNLFRSRDTLLAAFELSDSEKTRSIGFDTRYQLPIGENAYIAPRMRITRRDERNGPGSQTTFYPSVRLVWKPAEQVELEASIGRIHRDERYFNYDWSGERQERSFVAHMGYNTRF